VGVSKNPFKVCNAMTMIRPIGKATDEGIFNSILLTHIKQPIPETNAATQSAS